MSSLVKLEISKCLKRKEFTFILLLVFFAIALDFTFICIRFGGANLSSVPSAYDSTILTNIVKSPLYPVFSILLPITVSLIYSDSYLEEELNETSSYINTRVSRSKNIVSKAIAMSIISFFIILIPLLIEQILGLITFPIQGYTTFGLPDYKHLSYIDKDIILDKFSIYHPYMNNIIFMIIRSISAVCFTLISYGFSFIPKINKYLAVLSSLIFNTLIMSIFSALAFLVSNFNENVSNILFTNIFYTNAYGNIVMLFGILIVYIAIGFSLIYYKGIKQKS